MRSLLYRNANLRCAKLIIVCVDTAMFAMLPQSTLHAVIGSIIPRYSDNNDRTYAVTKTRTIAKRFALTVSVRLHELLFITAVGAPERSMAHRKPLPVLRTHHHDHFRLSPPLPAIDPIQFSPFGIDNRIYRLVFCFVSVGSLSSA